VEVAIKQLGYNIKQRKRASTLLALSETELEASRVLLEHRLFREAVVHLYFTSFYLSHALLCHKLNANPSHNAVESHLHREYGRRRWFPNRYVRCHSRLHQLRNEIDYRSAHTPEPSLLLKELKTVQSFTKYASKLVPAVSYDLILRSIAEENPGKVFDFSVDVYCPKTYSHHTRITAWFPPFYLDIFNTSRLASIVKDALARLKVSKSAQYVAGINSKLDQYGDKHLLMIDIDSFDAEVESTLRRIGGILFKSGRGYHFIGSKVIESDKARKKALRRALRHPVLKDRIDKKHIAISLKRGYSTLRITDSSVKPTIPRFFKEL
jgi:uncharacterized protein (UPF0332 family)